MSYRQLNSNENDDIPEEDRAVRPPPPANAAARGAGAAAGGAGFRFNMDRQKMKRIGMICCIITAVLFIIALLLFIYIPEIINSVAPPGCDEFPQLEVGSYTFTYNLITKKYSIYKGSEFIGQFRKRYFQLSFLVVDLITANGTASLYGDATLFANPRHYFEIHTCSPNHPMIGKITNPITFGIPRYYLQDEKGSTFAEAQGLALLRLVLEVYSKAANTRVATLTRGLFTITDTWYLDIVSVEPEINTSYYMFLAAINAYA